MTTGDSTASERSSDRTDDRDELAARDTAVAQAGAARSMTVLTFVGRIAGFVRVVVVVVVFGRSFLGATYQAANGVPNLVFELIVAGALSSVLVPTLVRHLEARDEYGARRIADRVLGTSLVVVGAVTAVLMLLADPIARLLFIKDPDPEKIALGRLLLWFFLPQTLLYVVAMVATGVLQSRRRFLAPVVAPLWNNVVVIGVYLAYATVFEATARGTVQPGGVVLLGLGTTAGVAALAFSQLPFVRRAGVRIRPRWGWRDPDVRNVFRRGLWAVGYLGLNSVMLAVMNVLAQQGDNVVPLSFAYACFLLPYALFAVTLSTAALPALSRFHAAGDDDRFADESARLLRNCCFTLVPAAVGLWLVAGPLTATIASAARSAGGPVTVAFLQTFALAVPAYGLFLAITRISYARNDTRAPTVANLGGTAVAIAVMIVVTSLQEGAGGLWILGVATALGAIISCVLLARRHVRGDAARSAAIEFTKSLAGAVVMVVLGLAVRVVLGDAERGAFADIVEVGLVTAVGLAGYLVTTRLLGAHGWQLLRRA